MADSRVAQSSRVAESRVAREAEKSRVAGEAEKSRVAKSNIAETSVSS